MVTVHRLFAASAVVLSAVLAIGAAHAGEISGKTAETTTGMITMTGGIGLLGLYGDEFVYAAPGSNNTTSHLIWTSLSPVLTTGMNVQLPQGWTISAKADFSASGVGGMDDYDWFGLNFIDYNSNDWTHHSNSSSPLDWYFSGQILVGRDLKMNDSTTVNLNAGLSYTDVQWTASGGTFTYSNGNTNVGCGFRGCSGALPDGRGITYHQQFPALIAGVDFNTQQGAWSFGASAHGGVTFSAGTTDDHWLRSLTVIDRLGISPVVSVSADASYKVAAKTDLVFSGTLTDIFVDRGNASYTFHDGSFPNANYTDQNGEGLLSASVTAALKGHF